MSRINWRAAYQAFQSYPSKSKINFYRHELFRFCTDELPNVKSFYNRFAEFALRDQADAIFQEKRQQQPVKPIERQTNHSGIHTIASFDDDAIVDIISLDTLGGRTQPQDASRPVCLEFFLNGI